MQDRVLTAADSYSPVPDAHFAYGTAGFRALGKTLAPVVFRCGILSAIRSKSMNGKVVGLMVTASHHPEDDNGVKLIDPEGDMLEFSWESHATLLANAKTPNDIATIITQIIDSTKVDMSQAGQVFIGYDTRATSVELASAAANGIKAIDGVTVKVFAEVTTPQLHYLVSEANHGRNATVADYHQHLAQATLNLLHTTSQGHDSTPVKLPSMLVDCANGVGAIQMQKLMQQLSHALGPNAPQLELRNLGPNGLNLDCGADYVQKMKKLPVGISSARDSGRAMCSVDGDADRIVFYTTAVADAVHLLDGDRIAILFASFVMEQLSVLKQLDQFKTLTIGVVQTAYANGASRQYLEHTLKVPVVMAKTGVKNIHPKAQEFDIGIYFEANGHGTILHKPAVMQALSNVMQPTATASSITPEVSRAARALHSVLVLANPTVGDALCDLLVVMCILALKHWTFEQWFAMYTDLPSVTIKVKVSDRSIIKTNDVETEVVEPAVIRADIADALRAVGSVGRTFARASGTEDVVRVYAEAPTIQAAEYLAGHVAMSVCRHAAGVAPFDLSVVPLSAYMHFHPVPNPEGKKFVLKGGDQTVAVLLAAGQGTRFVSPYPKVLHPFLGKPFAQHAIDAAHECGIDVVVVIGHAAEQVKDTLGRDKNTYVHQTEQLGTGHGVYTSTRVLGHSFKGDIIVMYADNPGVDAVLLNQIKAKHNQNKEKYGGKYGGMILTGLMVDAAGYGRIVRGKQGMIIDIVEKKQIDRMSLTEDRVYEDGSRFSRMQLDLIPEFNSGIVIARADVYLSALADVLGSQTKPAPNTKYEYYATDFVKHMVRRGFLVDGWRIPVKDMHKLEGANTVEELTALEVSFAARRAFEESRKA
eukprot:TRINITY_DN8339_c0_g1::TRINITY_DN8339_c0_g1_i1::g.29165::m.29165 TRINITY_DN8339_c0_g1::TRINITY_DN8339_c0_g1_i1::g.29165  ORF type:complete len:872 (+),score=284.15,sp/F1RQM2/AGM1_PIG/44.63/6e-134,NTP_transf_3/PF12804.2/3.8e+03,NTP_transf_3/PF12804.2/9.8e-15,PGM_PMM_I/PF02878.11/7.7e-05,PGM_PMM_I/PF02878.11/2e-07,PGM_PMM_I/PF02878.11/9.8e+02,PGM_PMM_IV/PF00408.15/4e-09,PGM_PMM_IV/PF00408.15/5.7e+03,NTP_transferase/PF00483.18/3.3e-09,PGM_PMM_II/PF02879.11/4.8e-08,PGM_PMM_II/PF02879.11/5.4e+03,PGM_P